jgi:DNA-binding MarR family transcriptional regulator
LTELARTLSISKASVSTVARQLQEGGMIERLPSSTRQHLYRAATDQRERLEDFRDFCEFSAQDYRDELMQRWLDYRGKRRK